jgi:serine/threonine protein phosphatase PrpC
MPFSDETTRCEENHVRAQTAQGMEEERIKIRNKEGRYVTVENARIFYETNDDSTQKNTPIIFPYCAVAQGQGGLPEKPNNYQQDFFGAAVDDRIAELTVEQIKQALYETFETLGELTANLNCGSTFSVAIATSVHIITAHVGDTRIIMCCDGKATACTWDHEVESEKARIRKAGGFISKNRYGEHRIGGVLNISRSFGNGHIEGKLHTPSLNVQPRPQNGILVIASDGLWHAVAPSEVAELTAKNSDLKSIAHDARATAYLRSSYDNCFVLVTKPVPNGIYFGGDGHGFAAQQIALYDAVNIVKSKFLEILRAKITIALNPNASPDPYTQATITLGGSTSGDTTQEYDDEPTVLNPANQSTSTTATTNNAHRRKRNEHGDDDNRNDDDNDDNNDDRDDNVWAKSSKFARR